MASSSEADSPLYFGEWLKRRRQALDLTQAGPVRGEAYDRGRFKLRQLICRTCGGLADVQVGLDGAPYSFAMPEVG